MAEIIIAEIPATRKTSNEISTDSLPHSVQITLEIIRNLSVQRGYCFAFNQTLAEMRKVGISTIKRHIATLIAEGFLTCKHVGHDRRLYPNGLPMGQQESSRGPLHNTKETLRTTKGKDSVCQQQETVSPPEEESPASVQAPLREAVCTGAPPAAPRTTSPGAGMGYADKKEEDSTWTRKHGYVASGTGIKTVATKQEVNCQRVHGQSTKPPAGKSMAYGSKISKREERSEENEGNGISKGSVSESANRGMGIPVPRRGKAVLLRSRNVGAGNGIGTAPNRVSATASDSVSAPNERNEESFSLLTIEGVSPSVAAQIVASHDAQTIRHKVLHYRQQRALGKAHGVGFLVASFYKQWSCKVMDATPEQLEAQQQKRRQQGYVPRRAIQPATVTERPQESAETASARLAALRRLQRHSEGIGGVGV